MTIQLSKRLARIAEFVEPGARLADIGTDHAYIPIYLAQKGTIDFAVASDIGAGPTQIARNNVQAHGVQNLITVRQADGLLGLHLEDGLDTIIIAGMGGQLIGEILTTGQAHRDGTETLILAPNRDDYMVRKWLKNHDFGILDEALVADEGHVYPIIVAGQTKPAVPYTEADLVLGPVLRRKRSPVFLAQLTRQIDTSKRVLANLKHATTDKTAKIQAETARLAMLQEEYDGPRN